MVCQNCGQQFEGTVCPNCGAPAMQQPMGGTVVVEKRSIGICILLSIVTFGIYMFYWIYKLHEETHAVAGEAPDISGGLVILLTIVTFGIYGIYWCYKQGERIDKIHAMRGVPAGNNAVLYLVLGIFIAIVAYALMQNELNTYA